jgi:type IX secretion system PorP/SprF family membrane protein
MKRLLHILFLVVIYQTSFGQQLTLYDQYLYNKFMINPAHAGSDGFTSLNMTAREQWLGYTGAPRTYSLSFQTRVLKRGYKLSKNFFNQTVYTPKKNGRVGFGGYIFSDRNGYIQRTGFEAAYSYHLWIKNYTQLSFGLAFTGYHFIINATEQSFTDPNEPWLNDSNLRRGIFVPDFDFGVYLLNPHFDFGFSILQILGAAAKIGDNAYKNYRMDRHFYTFGSYNFNITNKIEIEPSTLFKISEQLKPQIDMGLTISYDEKVWAGVTYRTGGSLISNIRFRYLPQGTKWTALYFGYAFDFTLSEMQKATFGTHELTLALKLGDSSKKFRWLDRY